MARDTDLDWTIIASHQPYFGVLANERFLAHNLNADAINEFYATGVADIDYVVRTLQRISNGAFAPRVGLDFGCGVGRLTFAMAAYAQRVIGVDVAPDMLRIAKEQASLRNVSGAEFVSDVPSEKVDWLNSLIVFQHIPPVRGHEIFRSLVDLVAPRGFVSVQLSFYRDRRHTDEVVRDIAAYRYDGQTLDMLETAPAEPGAMSMYDYDMNRVLRVLFEAGFNSVLAEHTDHGGCHGAWLFAQRGE